MLWKSEKYRDAIGGIIEGGDFSPLCGAHVLVSGATGLIGKAVVDVLTMLNEKGCGIKVFASSRSSESFNARFTPRRGLEFFKFDLTEPVREAPHFDFIIHAASNADPKMFDTDPAGTMTANFLGMYNLLEYMRKERKGRLLYVSSGEVYGQYDGKSDAFDESYSGRVNFTEKRGCYPSAKRAAENLAVCYSEQYGCDAVILRPSHTYGPTQTERDSRAMSEFFRLGAEKRDIVLRSEGKTVRSYTCVFDAVSALFEVLLKGECGEAYNAANRNSVLSIRELAELIAENAGVKVVFDIGEVKGAGKIERGVLSADKIEALGWSAQYPPQRGVKTTLEIMREIREKDLTEV